MVDEELYLKVKEDIGESKKDMVANVNLSKRDLLRLLRR